MRLDTPSRRTYHDTPMMLINPYRFGAPAPPSNVFFEDTFTDVAGTALGSHAPTVGTSWAPHPTVPTAAVVINNANEARSDITGQGALYVVGPAPASADYYVECVVRVKQANEKHTTGPCARIHPTAATFYHARYNQDGSWQLFRFVNGSATSMGSYNEALAAGAERLVRLSCVGSDIRVYIDGVERIQATSTHITAAGQAGMRFFVSTTGGAVGDTRGLSVDNFKAETF